MQKSRAIFLLLAVLTMSGCSGACSSVGQAPGSFSGGSGWTGIANIGITGIHAGICGAGVLIDKAKPNSNSEAVETTQPTATERKDSQPEGIAG